MQTTLLGLGITFILALLAALVGPLFVDWGQYRAVFEAHASRQVGMPVRVHGSVGARLLPSPSLTLRDLEAGPEGREAPFKAAEVAVEFALGSLLRGEWRATEARIVRPQLSAGLDETGRLDWSGYALQPDADVQSIERLSIEGGEVHLADRASGGRLRLEKLWFKGEVKSLLAGPLKGEGGFALDGEGYGFRIALGRLAEDGARVKLSLDTLTRPFSIEADGLARLEQQVPIFEGSLTAIRPAHVTLKGGRPVASEPWRVATRVKARAAGVLFEQIDAQYGPDDRALRIGGAAELKLRGGVRLEGVFSARQIDIDRLVGLPEAQRRLPILALRRFAESFADGLKWPVSLRLGIGIDVLTLGGAAVQQVRGDIAAEDSTWNIENLEFRAPGLTQVRTSGRLSLSSQGAAFAGPLVIEANHLSALVGWLEGRDAPASQGGTFRAAGEVTLGTHGFAIERLKAEIDRRTLEGRVLYTWAAPPRPARLDAELRAADLDIDQALAFARAALAGTKLDMPGETMLNLDLGRARIAGIEAKGVRARLREDADGVSIERLAIADLGGTALDARGRIESLSALPQGSIHVDIDGPRIDGILDMLGRFAPAATAETLRPLGPRLAPAKLRASLRLAAAGASSAANLALAGRLGPLRVDLSADALGELSAPAAAVVGLSGRLEAEDGRALVSILGLDPIVAAEQAPGSLELTVSGPLTGDLKVDGRLVAGGLDATWRGTGRWSDAEAVNAAFDVSVWARNASLPSQTSPQPRFPIVVKARVLWKDRTVRLDEMTGTVAGTGVRGRLAITRGRSIEVNGNLQLDALDVGPALAAVAGAPLPTQNPARWQVQPFGRGLLADLSGEIELGVTRAVFTPSLVARQVRSVLRLSGAEVAIEDIDATLAGGRLTGRLELRGAVDALAAKGRLTLAGAEISALSGQAASFLSGRVGLELEAEGRGPGPASLIGSLRGKGTISLEGVRVAGLAARPFEAPIAAVEQGAPLDPGKVTAMVEAALAAGRLTLPRVETPLTLSAGLLRWGQITAVIDGTELSATGGIDLAEWAIDARLTLSGPAARGDAGRPEIFVLFRGPLESPRRTLDASAFAGWLMLRAVDVQAKRVEELEAARRREAEGARMGSPPAASPLTDRRSDAGPPAAVPSGEPNAASARTAASPTSHPRRPRRGANGSSQEHPLEGPPPLPPPLEIRPLPGPRSGRGSTSGQATQELLVGPNR